MFNRLKIINNFIIENFLGLIYGIMNTILISKNCEADFLIFIAMFWAMFIWIICLVNFCLYRHSINFHRGMNKEKFAKFDRRFAFQLFIRTFELSYFPAIYIINKNTYALAIFMILCELFLLIMSLIFKYDEKFNKFIKFNYINEEQKNLELHNIKLVSIIDDYNKNLITRDELLKNLKKDLDNIYIIRIFEEDDNEYFYFQYQKKICFTTFELAERYVKNYQFIKVAKMCLLRDIMRECLENEKNLKIYYSKKKCLKITVNELLGMGGI